jgi:hypothetical protein
MQGGVGNSRAGSLVLRCGCICAALIYAAVAIGNGLDRMAFSQPVASRSVPRPFAANALEVAGEAELRTHPQVAAGMAEQLVAAAPIEPFSTALLGAARAAGGDESGAERAFRVAGQLGWRVPHTQAYWLRRALALGDAQVAAQRLDALLRQQPELLRESDALEPFESGGAMQAALIDRLATRPPWLGWYSGEVDPIPLVVLARRAAVLMALADRGEVLGCPAIMPTVRLMAAHGLEPQAQTLQRRHCSGGPASQ